MSVNQILLSLGVKPNSMGYKYLCDIIELALNGIKIFPLNAYAYQEIAKKYDNTVNGVEKNIQNCINTAWINADTDTLYEFFGETISDAKGKPTNKHFICAVCEKLGCPVRL